MAHSIVRTLVLSEPNTAGGVQYTIDSPYSQYPNWNITRPGVLRQYFGLNVVSSKSDGYVKRYTYGGGYGTACRSVGTNCEFF